MKKYTISVLTYRAYPLVKACIQSIFEGSTPGTFDLILTNNGNTNGAAEYFNELQSKYPDCVRVVHNTENKGFIGPNNHALVMTQTPYFVMLNDDAEVPRGWLEELEKPFTIYPKAALSGLSGGCQSLNEDFNGRPHGAFEYLEGSCLMCKTDIVKKHGLFSNYLEFAYGEDSDLSLRMRQLGYTLHKIDMPLKHMRAQTAMHVPQIKQIQAKNHAVLRKKWGHYLRVRKFDFPIIVRRWAARGDVLISTATIKKIKEQNPLSPIIVETAFPDIFRDNPDVAQATTKGQRTFDMRYINLDMAYENKNLLPILDGYAETAEVPKGHDKTSIYPNAEEIQWAQDFLKAEPVAKTVGRPKQSATKETKWVAIHAGPTTWVGKNWPFERWTELLKALKKEYNANILLIGHNETTPLPCDRDARGTTDHHKTAALLQQCDLFIGLDSFPLHCAQAVGTPAIGLFGVTKPEMILTPSNNAIGVTGDKTLSDYGIRHLRPGQVDVMSDGAAMRSISVAQVLSAVGKFLPLVVKL
jgi:ADP-heptose:LPS heptosyltransferase